MFVLFSRSKAIDFVLLHFELAELNYSDVKESPFEFEFYSSTNVRDPQKRYLDR